MPGIERRRRAENLGWALLASVVFHILVLFFFVKFVYSTQLGAWSNEHYGPVAQNLWGFGKHLLDLPFKLALPFILWAAFYFHDFQQNLRRTLSASAVIGRRNNSRPCYRAYRDIEPAYRLPSRH